MKRFFYYFIKVTIKWASHCYFRKIKVYGLENIPKDGGILFSPNHQGAFLDPLLVGCNLPKTVTSLTRSDLFGGPLQWFMDALKMLPVYRIRNGYSNLKKKWGYFWKLQESSFKPWINNDVFRSITSQWILSANFVQGKQSIGLWSTTAIKKPHLNCTHRHKLQPPYVSIVWSPFGFWWSSRNKPFYWSRKWKTYNNQYHKGWVRAGHEEMHLATW